MRQYFDAILVFKTIPAGLVLVRFSHKLYNTGAK